MATDCDKNGDPAETLAILAERACAGQGVSRDEALWLAGECPLPMLMAAADKVRRHFFGDGVVFCGIVNARSGRCPADCAFCSQSSHHQTSAPEYPLVAVSEMIAAAANLAANVGCFGIVTSGPSLPTAEVAKVAEAAAAIRQRLGIEVSASLGRINRKALSILKSSGVRHYHHNLETSVAFYPRICTTHRWEEKLNTLRTAQELGFELCSGGLFGMGETWADRIDLALTLRALGVRSVPINFLNPVAGTPLGQRPPLAAEEALRIIALYRMLLPTAVIRLCGGRPLVLARHQAEALRSGANGLMTGNYLTTPGFDPASDRRLVEELGLRVVKYSSL